MKKKQDNDKTPEAWSPLATIQKIITPLAERILNRRENRKKLGKPSPIGVSKQENPPEVSLNSKTPGKIATIVEEGNQALEFHEQLVSSVMKALVTDGWQPSLADSENFGYDLELERGPEKVAVQVRSQKAKVYLPQLKRFEDFLAQHNSRRFARGFLISSSGFAQTVYAYLESEGLTNIKLGTIENGALRWYPDEEDEGTMVPREKRYIGVFTCKGGVGKTTVSAHLAGAFALCGYHVVLVDLDRQGNLRKLMGEGIYLPHPRKKTGTTITVLDHHEWDGSRDPETGIVICDCNPEFSQNPQDLMNRFDYCVIPTTLNPLGINKNAYIIRKTFQEIRTLNPKAELFVLINNYYPKETKRNKVLNSMMKKEFKSLTKADSKCHYIDPEIVAVRFSNQLLYWGYETVIEDSEPQLAFRAFGGKSFPRSDFLSLAEYLESHTDLEILRKKEHGQDPKKQPPIDTNKH